MRETLDFFMPTHNPVLELDTREFVLEKALIKLRDILAEGRYALKNHTVSHARAEGFLEQDVIQVLYSGKVRAVYPQDGRWLISGYYQVDSVRRGPDGHYLIDKPVRLPLHVVVDVFDQDFWIDVVTAFVPKHPHDIVSRGRLALMMRFDQTEVKSKVVQKGERGRKRWRKHSRA
jgi:hypothetical protein